MTTNEKAEILDRICQDFGADAHMIEEFLKDVKARFLTIAREAMQAKTQKELDEINESLKNDDRNVTAVEKMSKGVYKLNNGLFLVSQEMVDELLFEFSSEDEMVELNTDQLDGHYYDLLMFEGTEVWSVFVFDPITVSVV